MKITNIALIGILLSTSLFAQRDRRMEQRDRRMEQGGMSLIVRPSRLGPRPLKSLFMT